MVLFIFESLGTSELILIGIIALIFLGPRRLPQIARTIGKTMADIRNTTNEFKSTWEREVDFEHEITAIRTGELEEGESISTANTATTVARNEPVDSNENKIAPPEITPVQSELFHNAAAEKRLDETKQEESDDLSDKQNWL